MTTQRRIESLSFASGGFKKEREYWLSKLMGDWEKSSFPYDFRGIESNGRLMSKLEFSLPQRLCDRTVELCQGLDQRIHMILVAGIVVLLKKYTNREVVTLGIPIYRQDVEGNFLNTALVLKNDVFGGMSFKYLLMEEIRKTIIEANAHQNYPIETLLEQLGLTRTNGEFPLFDIAVLLENIHEKKYIAHIPVNLVFSFVRRDNRLSGFLEFNERLYRESSVRTILEYFNLVLQQVLFNLDISLEDVDILPEGKKRFVRDMNRIEGSFPTDMVLPRLFQEQAAGRPDRVAVSWERQQQSYGFLNREADRLAHHLRRRGLGPGHIVGLVSSNPRLQVRGILGTLKSGSAYLPIDPDSPGNRIVSILKDARPTAVLVDNEAVSGFGITTLRDLNGSGEKTEIVCTEPAEQISQLDSLPFPDRSLVDYERYNQYIGQAMVKHSMALQGSRGCPYSCAYCHRIWPRTQKARSPENLFTEMSALYDMGVRRFSILDDIFNLNRRDSSAFFDLIIKNQSDIQLFFPNGLRGDLLDTEYIDLMVQAGTVGLALALETASPRLQKLLRKNLDLSRLEENLAYFCREYPRIILELFTMHGFPSETEEEAGKTLDFIRQFKWLHFPYFHILKIYPNTDMEKIALEHGITPEAIHRSVDLAYHELPDTLPFDKNFTLKCQADFLNRYFLDKDRIRHVLPYQVRVLNEDELVQKYNSYLQAEISSLSDLLDLVGFETWERGGLGLPEDPGRSVSIVPEVKDLNVKLASRFVSSQAPPDPNGLRILLLDLSQYFSAEEQMLYDVVEPPLGLMYLLSYLKREMGEKVVGKIAKSRLDFDSFSELRRLIADFGPHIIGIRTLSFYKEFFHRTVALIRQWGFTVPVIAGGPYATSDYVSLLQNTDVDLAVMGEGELTFTRLIDRIIRNHGKLPDCEELRELKGIAFRDSTGAEDRQDDNLPVVIMEDAYDRWSADSVDPPQAAVLPTDPAYVIFTSGSTGKPKGAVIHHRNVAQLMCFEPALFDFNERDIWVLFHSYCFDFSVWELWGAFRYGAKLHLIHRRLTRDPMAFRQYVLEEAVTVLNQTPSAFANFIEAERGSRSDRLAVRWVIFGGEALSPGILKAWREKYPETRLINMYGITETTVHVTFKEITDDDIKLNVSNIGKPIPTLFCHISDPNLRRVPAGIAGEICVGGEGVGRGYLNRVELTASKFVYSPSGGGGRLYRSGDRGRWLEESDIEYLGRGDQQIQIRGYRVEPGEIEARLLDHPKVGQAAMIVREDAESGNKSLCAYLVSERGVILESAELRDYLGRLLPDYMIPAHFILLESMPLTSNGKLDQRALPKPGSQAEGRLLPPRDDTEMRLAEIWKNVLDITNIGIRQSFFEVGGDSINSIRLLSLINNSFEAGLVIADLFEAETIENLAQKIDRSVNQKRERLCRDVEEALEKLRANYFEDNPESEDIEDIYPMSDIEKGMIFYSMKNPSSSLYHDQLVYQLKYTDFNFPVFKKAFESMIRKHPILRTTFHLEDFTEPVQVVLRSVSPEIYFEDISVKSRREQESFIRKRVTADRKRSFRVDRPPLWRMGIFKLGATSILFFWSFHHAILDGWSNASLMTELNNTYRKLSTEPDFKPEALRSSYRDFVVSQMMESKREEPVHFWKKELADHKRLDFSHLGTTGRRGERKKEIYFLDSRVREKIKERAGEWGTTIKNICFGAYLYMLGMVSYENDLVVGLVTNNRPVCPDGDRILGCFLNTIPVRFQIPALGRWIDFQHLVDRKLKDLKKFESVSLFRILRIIGEKTQDRNPIFDTIFNYTDFYIYGQAELDPAQQAAGGGMEERLDVEGFESTNTLLDFNISNTFDRLCVFYSYSTALLDEKWAASLWGYFRRVLDRLLEDPQGELGKGEILSDTEKQKLLVRFNDTDREFPGDHPAARLFEEQAGRTPDRTALVLGDRSMSYAHLDRCASGLAGMLTGERFGPISKKGENPVIGLFLERSPEMLTAIMGVLKTGAAYLPIDPNFPPERINFMLENSRVNLLLSFGNVDISSFPTDAPYRVEDLTGIIETLDLAPGSPTVSSPSHLAYVIYTSGSVGKPKGVMIENRSLVNFISGISREIEFRIDDNVLCLTTISFDIFVLETLVPLVNGSKVVVGTADEQVDNLSLLKVMLREKISIFQATPSRLQVLLAGITGGSGLHTALAGLRYLLVGGEPFPEVLLEQSDRLVKGKIVNLYGPTEATVWVTAKSVGGNARLDIGKPIANTRIYILDRNRQVQPIGITGELWISGESLARGYIYDELRTRESFFDNPFENSGKIYRSGDLARWLADGNIEIFGRVDHQVKIRGFRVEPGEIEKHLLEIETIKEAVVLLRTIQSGEKKTGEDLYLCAYFVAEEKVSYSELRDRLAGKLPAYMVPAYFIQLEHIPLTANKKVDRAALPQVDVDGTSGFVPPRDELESRILSVWGDVLNLPTDSIGIFGNFFDLGGHSLKAIHLVTRLHRELEVKISLDKIFAFPTIAGLAAFIRETEPDRFKTIQPAEKREYYPLSSGQKRLFYLQQLSPRSTAYNLPRAFRLQGSVDLQQLRSAFQRLVERHEVLRTSINLVKGEPVQRIHPLRNFSLEIRSAVNDEPTPEEWIRSFIKPFDLSVLFLIRAGILQYSEHEYLLVIDMHHLVADGYSLNLLMREIADIYHGLQLPSQDIQYKDYACWQQSNGYQAQLREQKEFWLQQFDGAIEELHLPVDHPGKELRSFSGDVLTFELDRHQLEGLRRIGKEAEATLFMVSLAIYYAFLARLSNRDDIVVGTVTEGRNHADLERVVGMFVNTLALRNFPRPAVRFRDFLSGIKERTLSAFRNQDFQFDDLVKILPVDKKKINPLFDVMFSFVSIDAGPAGRSAGEEVAEEDGVSTRPAPFRIFPWEIDNKISHFDLMLAVVETGDSVRLLFEYASDLFDRSTIESFKNDFLKLVDSVVRDVDQKLEDIELTHDLLMARSKAIEEDADAYNF